MVRNGQSEKNGGNGVGANQSLEQKDIKPNRAFFFFPHGFSIEMNSYIKFVLHIR